MLLHRYPARPSRVRHFLNPLDKIFTPPINMVITEVPLFVGVVEPILFGEFKAWLRRAQGGAPNQGRFPFPALG